MSRNRPLSSQPRQAAPWYGRDLPQRDQPGRRAEGVFPGDRGGFAHPAPSPRSPRAGLQAPAPLLRRWARTAGPAGQSRAPLGTKPERTQLERHRRLCRTRSRREQTYPRPARPEGLTAPGVPSPLTDLYPSLPPTNSLSRFPLLAAPGTGNESTRPPVNLMPQEVPWPDTPL